MVPSQRRGAVMALAWYGNPDWNDDRPPTVAIPVICAGCKQELFWNKPLFYDGEPPKCKCGGAIKRCSITAPAKHAFTGDGGEPCILCGKDYRDAEHFP